MMVQTLKIGDGSNMPISHIGSISISSFNKSFQLDNTLCVPKAKKNIIYVSKFCDNNSTSIEFFPLCFVVKYLHSRKPLAREQNNDGVYELETKELIISSNALATECLSHGRNQNRYINVASSSWSSVITNFTVFS